jgi:hypothetical protein
MIATFIAGMPCTTAPGGRINRRRQRAEVIRDDRADEEPQNHQELALLNQVGLARLVDELENLSIDVWTGMFLSCRLMRRPNSMPSALMRTPTISSERPSTPMKVSRDRSGRIRFASPPA